MGDGVVDAVVSIEELDLPGSHASTQLAAGPLRRSLTLPGDELATVTWSAVKG